MERLFKVSAVSVLSLMLCLALTPLTAFASSFSDVQDDSWYGTAGYIDQVVSKGFMTGYGGTDMFGPDNPMTRAEAATVLYRVVSGGDPDRKTSDPAKFDTANETGLPDVQGGKFYTAAANFAVKSGFITGYKDTGLFVPDQPITRQELATIMARSAAFKAPSDSIVIATDGGFDGKGNVAVPAGDVESGARSTLTLKVYDLFCGTEGSVVVYIDANGIPLQEVRTYRVDEDGKPLAKVVSTPINTMGRPFCPFVRVPVKADGTPYGTVVASKEMAGVAEGSATQAVSAQSWPAVEGLFLDGKDISPWALDALQWAFMNTIVSGDGSASDALGRTTVRPLDKVTRAEAAKMFSLHSQAFVWGAI